ncbi:hypothetical protein LTR10_018760 [Elasticomyces elasticus]|nr:hypothetical protein LTR10_018760 [Elasticomyces elasticus]KAK5178103.1 hypothetical protein LTR44_009409 [Eurotiomycetes sp. CCFEE 6388]
MSASKDTPHSSAGVVGHEGSYKDEETQISGIPEEEEEPVVTLKTWVVVMIFWADGGF